YAVVCGTENVLAMTLSLPDKTQVVRKMAERRRLRHARRGRKTRRRPARFSNRRPGPGWIAPSQLVLVLARERMMCTLCALYPITLAGIEDVRFDHRKRWGAYFSTVEIGKERLCRWWDAHAVNARYYQGYETKEKREEYGYRKTHDKRAEVFTAHCTDVLTLACMVVTDAPVTPGPFVVVNNLYRPVRRRLHDSQPARGGVRAPYSRGT